MDFNQFVDEVKGRIKQFLPIEYEGAQVKIEEIKKLNENYLGITVLKENQVIAPTFNLNQLYEMFQSDPQNSMENILRNITELVLDAPEQFDPKSITEYETAKDKLFIRVSSAEKNEEMLQNVPHQMREDLAITYHLAISIDDIGVGSTMITNDILKRYGISEEQLHADAMENSPNVRPVQVMIMGSMIEQLMGMGSETIMRRTCSEHYRNYFKGNGNGKGDSDVHYHESADSGWSRCDFLSGSNGADWGRFSGRLLYSALFHP